MNRKEFIVFLSAVILCGTVSWAPPVDAAQRVYRLGILIPESGQEETQTVKGLKDRLKDLGYVEGENLAIELRDAKSDRGALKTGASDLVSKQVDVIFTSGSGATEAAKAATKQIPIVFQHPADPVALGFLKNLKRPEGNVTGVGGFSSDVSQKRLEILKAIVPNLRRVHIFYDANSKYSADNLLVVQKAAAKMPLEVSKHPVKTGDEFKYALSQMPAQKGDAILQIPDGLIESNASLLFGEAKKLRLPTMFYEESWAIKGSLVTYGPSYTQMGRQAAELVDRLLKGAKPKDVPVQSASKFDLVINLRIASIIGLNITSEMLSKADKVIR